MVTKMEKTVLKTKTKQQLQKPPMYMVLFHNDDYTTMEFVILVLMSIFRKSITEATSIMLEVHKSGVAMVGIYTYEVAQTSIKQVQILAEEYEYPLLVTLEEVV